MTLVSGHSCFPIFYGTFGTHDLIMENLGETDENGEFTSQTVHTMIRVTHDQCVAMSRQICEGIVHLHDINILHNDIKQNNIVLKSSTVWPFFQVKIIDFGKSTLKSSPNVYCLSIEKMSIYNEKHRYLAHELRNVRNTAQSEATDCYSVGYVLRDIAMREKFEFLRQLSEKMKTQKPQDRLDIPTALAQLRLFRKSQ